MMRGGRPGRMAVAADLSQRALAADGAGRPGEAPGPVFVYFFLRGAAGGRACARPPGRACPYVCFVLDPIRRPQATGRCRRIFKSLGRILAGPCGQRAAGMAPHPLGRCSQPGRTSHLIYSVVYFVPCDKKPKLRAGCPGELFADRQTLRGERAAGQGGELPESLQDPSCGDDLVRCLVAARCYPRAGLELGGPRLGLSHTLPLWPGSSPCLGSKGTSTTS